MEWDICSGLTTRREIQDFAGDPLRLRHNIQLDTFMLVCVTNLVLVRTRRLRALLPRGDVSMSKCSGNVRTICGLATALLLSAVPSLAAELPTRKAGLWEIRVFGVPVKQCIDAATDMMMFANSAFLSMACSKHDVQHSGDTWTVDATCTFMDKNFKTHMVVKGSLDSSYTQTMTSEGDADIVGTGKFALKMEGKWLGPCAADQKPGDTIGPTRDEVLQQLSSAPPRMDDPSPTTDPPPTKATSPIPATAIASGSPVVVEMDPQHPKVNIRVDIGTLRQIGDAVEAEVAWPLLGDGSLARARDDFPGVTITKESLNVYRKRTHCRPDGTLDYAVERRIVAPDGTLIVKQAYDADAARKNAENPPYGLRPIHDYTSISPGSLVCWAAARKCEGKDFTWPPPPNETPLEYSERATKMRADYNSNFIPRCRLPDRGKSG
jgi:hypothetical protein